MHSAFAAGQSVPQQAECGAKVHFFSIGSGAHLVLAQLGLPAQDAHRANGLAQLHRCFQLLRQIQLRGKGGSVAGAFCVSASTMLFNMVVMLFLFDISKRLGVIAIWLFGLEDNVELIAPQKAAEEYRRKLKAVLEQYG